MGFIGNTCNVPAILSEWIKAVILKKVFKFNIYFLIFLSKI